MKIERRSLLAASGIIAMAGPAWAQSASTLEHIKASKKLRIGVTSAEPWFFKDPMSEANPAFRDWLSTKFAEYYKTGKPQVWFSDYLKSKGIDPTTVPGLSKEQWS